MNRIAYRMRLRSEILEIVRHLNAARRVLLTLAREHILTLMPAYTHTQPAQPITLALTCKAFKHEKATLFVTIEFLLLHH